MANRGLTVRDLLLFDEDVNGRKTITNEHRVIGRLKVFKIISQTVHINLAHIMNKKNLQICTAFVDT